MSPDTLKRTTMNPADSAQEESVIDTSGMSEGQARAMEVTEAARDHKSHKDSFAGRLFLGRYDPSLLAPFPMQNEEDRRVGDEIVAKVCSFLAKHLDADEVDETRTIPAQVIAGLRDLGVFKMKVPLEYGGLGFSQVNYNRVLLAIASHCGSTAVLVSAHQSIGVPQPLKMFGTPEQKEKYLTRIAQGELSAFALTEPAAGSDPAQMSTMAILSEDGTHYILNGTKQWATNGPIASLWVVMAQTPPKVYRGKEKKQITAFIVESDWPGVETTHRCDFMGLRAIHNGITTFTNVKVPVENVIWGVGKGLKLALKTLNTGRLTLPAACTGLGKQCLSIVRQWGNQREQWGDAIGRHEAGREKIAHIAATTFAMEAVTWLTSHWADEDKDIRIEAAMAKLFCSEAAWRIVDETMQFRGGRGYERAKSLRDRGEQPWPVERMMRDTRINTIIEGTSEIMKLFLAREALDPHLRLAMGLIKRGTTGRQKLKAFMGLMGFYSVWYPSRLIGWLTPRIPRFGSRGDALSKHDRFMSRASNKLAAKMFHAMATKQQKLEKEQILLGHLMDIGTELFAMAAACSYARALAKPGHGLAPHHNAVQIADVFCQQARCRIAEHFRSLKCAARKPSNALAGDVLDGGFVWLEEGVVQS
ncbi:MAG: acyl-CoA dehydrogenase family protein [Planctomycetota bacterium]|nr:acyl-CoA dehydrogenase family protein [Planctomycetota bacterium]